MTTDQATGQPKSHGYDYDGDPDALAWAHRKVEHVILGIEELAGTALAAGKSEKAAMLGTLAGWMRRDLLHGGRELAAFDPRLADAGSTIYHRRNPDDDGATPWRCPLCGADAWTSVSLDDGRTRCRRCTACRGVDTQIIWRAQ